MWKKIKIFILSLLVVASLSPRLVQALPVSGLNPKPSKAIAYADAESPDNYHNQINAYIIEALTQDAGTYIEKPTRSGSTDKKGDIFSKDYPPIEKPFLNREWLNRIIIEVTKGEGQVNRPIGLNAMDPDSNSAYLYPGKGQEIYLFSGIYEGRHLVDLRYTTNYSEEISESDFRFFTQLMDASLTEEDMPAEYDKFLEADQNYSLGQLEVFKSGLTHGSLYLRRDLTEEIEAGIYPNYTESLADPSKETLINIENLFFGQLDTPKPYVFSGNIMDDTIKDALAYRGAYTLERLEAFMSNQTHAHNYLTFRGSIRDINETEDRFYLLLDIYAKAEFLIEVPKAFWPVEHQLKRHDDIHITAREKGWRLDQFDKLLLTYEIESPYAFMEIN